MRDRGNRKMILEANNLSLLNFKLKLPSAKEVEYRVQSVTIPGLNLGTATMPNPFTPIFEPGNITYDDLSVQFLVGEELRDYLEIFDWMEGLGHPDNLSQYKNKRGDCSVIVLNSAKHPIYSIDFSDAYPVSLSPINFDSMMMDTTYFTASVSFRFFRMRYTRI